MFVRGVYNYDVDKASLEAGFVDDEPSMTDQSFAEEVDINTIVRRFGVTGEFPGGVVMPVYAHFEETFDFHSSMMRVRQAEAEFMKLPAELRSRFGNDPGALIEFLEVPENRPEAERLGIVVAKAPAPEAAPEVHS